ncbi:hypothetical protein M0R45_035414 [Rubus argutus]|uniref:Uncharacterized protein n=1 Tax=Rubus argutus TaxID=59490 RepID=A0AAW1VUS3_RUBAR
MVVFQSSVFCLQPPRDSFSRIHHSIPYWLAGFQFSFVLVRAFGLCGGYTWHFPGNTSQYSVFISENEVKEQKVMINETLLRIPKHQVKAMEVEVIRLIPTRIIYADPRASGLETLEDAYGIAVKLLLDGVEKTRRDMKKG